MGVTQISGQDGQATLHVFAPVVPVEQSLDRETVAEVMKAWSVTGGLTTQADHAGESVKTPAAGITRLEQ